MKKRKKRIPKEQAPLHFTCKDCGIHVAADEDGCCASCGRDCRIQVCDCIVITRRTT